MYDGAADRILLDLIDFGINRVNIPADLENKGEQEVSILLNNDLNSNEKPKCELEVPRIKEEYETSYEMKDIFILPMSLADEAYTCGEAVIYRQFSNDLNLNIERKEEYISFDDRRKEYDLSNARERYKMYQELEIHEQEIARLKETLNAEKEIPDSTDNIPCNERITKYRQMIRKQEKDMKELVELLYEGVRDQPMQQAISFIKSHSGMWSTFRDNYNRSVLHIFVERGNLNVVESLLLCGAHINEGEGCGVTPLMVAIMNQDIDMIKLLLKYEARVRGLFPGHLPTPVQMSERLQQKEISSILKTVFKQQEMQSISHAIEFLSITEIDTDILSENGCGHDQIQLTPSLSNESSEFSNQQEHKIKSARDRIITVGDVKTTVTTRGLKNRSPDEFGVFEETPGDFHALAYVMECLAKIFGPGGFYYIARHILGRLKVTPTSFENMFKEENYERNYEALIKFYWGLGLALVKKFEQSKFFPAKEMILVYKEKNEVNALILGCFKDWIQDQSKNDKTFAFFSTFVTEYGLLLQIHQEAVRHGNGKIREACWMKLLCLFASLNKKNYRDESFVHIVHFTTTWPLAMREMFRQNCSIAVKERKHHNMAIDEYVVSMVVKPIKEYAKKHTTLSMLQKINMNLELFKHIRRVYMKGFNVHRATARSKPDSLPDIVKTCWFVMKEKWFDNLQRKDIKKYAHNDKKIVLSDSATVEKKFQDTLAKGKSYIEENFKEMLLRLFPNTDYIDQ